MTFCRSIETFFVWKLVSDFEAGRLIIKSKFSFKTFITVLFSGVSPQFVS